MASFTRAFAAIAAVTSTVAGADVFDPLSQLSAEQVAGLPPAAVATLQLHRRLSSSDQAMGIPAACLTKCPSLESKKADMEKMAKEMATGMQGDNFAGMFETVMKQTTELMCAHKAEFICMANNQAECAPTPAGGAPDTNPTNLIIDNFDCMCNKCPTVAGAYGKMMGTVFGMLIESLKAMSSGGGTEPAEPTAEEKAATELKALQGMCPMVGVMPCIQKETACSGLLGGDDDVLMAQLIGPLKANATLYADQCEAKGISTEYRASSGSNSQVSDAMGMSSFPKGLVAVVAGLVACLAAGQ